MSAQSWERTDTSVLLTLSAQTRTAGTTVHATKAMRGTAKTAQVNKIC